ncbi:hypothetical protein TIFTF001_015352 [Ficus carica]|uniref:Uncharacterized protein n=1 Tax=Ficus carica TaxID=3494 RepID=A0AA88A4C1_FICCA|nr:hypothetical protein TIFTF001_015352 [Ficus carica]
MTLVREFYANAKEHRNHKTKLRGIVVSSMKRLSTEHDGVVQLHQRKIVPENACAECSRERALALFAIAKGMRMNVGAIINAAILHATNINNVSLPFPSLLIALFEMAGINKTNNSVCKPIWALDPNGIVRIWNNQLEEGEDEAGPSRPSAWQKNKALISDLHEMYQHHDE